MLVGRQRECHLIDQLLEGVTAGSSATMLMEGEAGIGKSCMIDYALGRAGAFGIARAQGVESEEDLPFAGLADLLRPFVGCLDRLAVTQRDVLRSVLALGPPVAADRFSICVATLSLIAEAAVDGPLLMVVDDGHWLDPASAPVLEFTARRLGDEPVGLIVAQRAGGHGTPHSAVDTLIPLGGVDPVAAAELLATTGRTVAPSVVALLVDGVAGNPLALLELAATLTSEQLKGRATIPQPLLIGDTLPAAFARRLAALDPSARQVLQLASADAAADLTALQGAAHRLGTVGGLGAATVDLGGA